MKAPLYERQIAEKTHKIKQLHPAIWNREQNCSRRGLFTICSLPNPTICFILPDRSITKITETSQFQWFVASCRFVLWFAWRRCTAPAVGPSSLQRMADCEEDAREYGISYNKELTLLIWCPAIKMGVTIPISVKFIREYVFNECMGLKSLTVGNCRPGCQD